MSETVMLPIALDEFDSCSDGEFSPSNRFQDNQKTQ